MNGLLKRFTSITPSSKSTRGFVAGLATCALVLAACDAATPTPRSISTVAAEPTAVSEAAVSEAATVPPTEAAAEVAPTEPATEPAIAPETSPTAEVAVEPTAEGTADVVGATVVATQAPPTVAPNDTGVSLTLPPSLAQSYQAALAAAIPRSEGPAFGGAAPTHVAVTFDQDQIQFPGNPRERQILIYPVSGLRAIDPFVSEMIDDLEKLLARKPRTIPDTQQISVLPVQYAAQVFHTQVQYLDFANGSGVRFLSAYAQDVTPITNENIFYTFQGLTSDGAYYISAFYPISSTALPETYAESTAAQNMDEFVKTYTDKYLPGVAEGLNSLPPDQFVPDLSQLDLLVQSIDAVPVLPAETMTSTATLTGTTEVITTSAPAATAAAEITAEATAEATMVPTAVDVLTPTAEATTATMVVVTPTAEATAEVATEATLTATSEPVVEPTEEPTEEPAMATAAPTAAPTTAPATAPNATAAAGALQPAGEATVLALVNVRSLPTTQARVLVQLRRNTHVQLLARSPRTNWLYVQLEDGRRGWISVGFLTTRVAVRNLPVLESDF